MLMFSAMAGHTLSMVIGIPNSMFYLKIHKQKNALINRYTCDMDQNEGIKKLSSILQKK